MPRAALKFVTVAPRTDNGCVDARFPDGTPSAPLDIVIAAIPDITGIAAGAYSENLRTLYVSGADASGSVLALTTISGTLGALGLSLSTDTLTGTATAGEVVLRLVVTKSGQTFVSNQFARTVTVAGPPDTLAPALPFGLTATRISNTQIDLAVDWPADPVTGSVTATDPVKVLIEKSEDGGSFGALTTLTAGGSQPNQAFSASAVGSMTSPSSSQTRSDITVTVTDGNFTNSVDAMEFVAAPVSGDFEIACQLPAFVSAYQWSQAGLCVRQNRTTLSPCIFVARRPDAAGNGTPMIYRPLQSGSIAATADAQISGAADAKIVRQGNVFTYRVWNAATSAWSTVGSATVVMTDPVEAGVFAMRVQSGAAISPVCGSVRINQLGTGSYSDTAVTADHAYRYRARSRDSFSTPNTSDYNFTTSISTTAATGQRDFHPGHGMTLDAGSGGGGLTGHLTHIAQIANEPTVKLVARFAKWSELETTQGNYDAGFALVDQYLDACEDADKYFCLWVKDSIFGNDASTPKADAHSFLPTYHDTLGGGPYLWPGGTKWNGYLLGTAKLDNRLVSDALIALFRAYAQRYNNHPRFEFIGNGETSVGVPIGYQGWSPVNFETELKRLMLEGGKAWTKKGMRLSANYASSDTAMQSLVAVANTNRWSVGGPDTTPTRSFTANRVFNGNLGGIDYRGLTPWVAEAQATELGGYQGTFTPQQLWDQTQTGTLATGGSMAPNYFFWDRNTYAGGTAQRWSTGILPFIRSINGAINTTRPTGY
jgi:hypothetical protein